MIGIQLAQKLLCTGNIVGCAVILGTSTVKKQFVE